MQNATAADKFNYFKNIGGEYKVGALQVESTIAPKVAELASPAGKISKTAKVIKAGQEESENYE